MSAYFGARYFGGRYFGGAVIAATPEPVRVGRWRRERYEPLIWRRKEEIPAAVQRAISKTALRLVKRAEQKPAQPDPVAVVEAALPGLEQEIRGWLQVLHEERPQQLAGEVRAMQAARRRQYEAALQQEVQRIALQREEEHVLSALFQYMH